jgi:hypothetical protein
MCIAKQLRLYRRGQTGSGGFPARWNGLRTGSGGFPIPRKQVPMRSKFTFWPGFARMFQQKRPGHELRELRESNNIKAGKRRKANTLH